MILKIPRDYRLYNCFRRLKELLEHDEKLANDIFMSLWSQLGYQVEAHGRSGRILKSEAVHFNQSVNCPGAFLALVESQTIVIATEEEYVCPMFEFHNRELDRDYMPNSVRGRAVSNFQKKLKKHSVKAFDYVAKMPPECWLLEDGATKILDFEMNRAILLIKMIDNLLGQDRRPFPSYTPALIQASHYIISRWSDDRLMVVLRRLYFVKGTVKDLPRTTADALRRFDDLVWKVMPDDGYLKWATQPNRPNEAIT